MDANQRSCPEQPNGRCLCTHNGDGTSLAVQHHLNIPAPILGPEHVATVRTAIYMHDSMLAMGADEQMVHHAFYEAVGLAERERPITTGHVMQICTSNRTAYHNAVRMSDLMRFLVNNDNRCRHCLCSEDRACKLPGVDPCHWVQPGLCSACADLGKQP